MLGQRGARLLCKVRSLVPITSRYPLWDMKSPALTAEVPHTTQGDKETRVQVAGADTGVDVELSGAPRSKAPSEGPMHQEHGYRTAKELGIPMPNPSIMPLCLATAIVIGFSGMLFLGRDDKTLAVSIMVGSTIAMFLITYNWLLTPLEDPH